MNTFCEGIVKFEFILTNIFNITLFYFNYYDEYTICNLVQHSTIVLTVFLQKSGMPWNSLGTMSPELLHIRCQPTQMPHPPASPLYHTLDNAEKPS